MAATRLRSVSRDSSFTIASGRAHSCRRHRLDPHDKLKVANDGFRQALQDFPSPPAVPAQGEASASRSAALDRLRADYRTEVKTFYAYLPADLQPTFINDALYHQKRYLDMLSIDLGHAIVELGSDKPFISHFVRQLNPGAEVHTISIDIPFSPYPITRIDIESEAFPYADGSIDGIIFTEVLEHLFRDPSWALHQMNRVLRKNGTLFLTTPNACGYDILVNLLSQVNPNGRNQFYESIESGHPHLWTADECRELLQTHGFQVKELTTVDYYNMPCPDPVRQFLQQQSAKPELNGQVLRIVATKQHDVAGPSYPTSLYPQTKPVKLQGALLKWAEQALRPAGDPLKSDPV